jgi:fimbrial isopeptide formation D2 family protein
VTVDLTEGTASGVTFVDTLDRGLAFVGLTSIVTNDAGHVSWTGPATASFAAVGAGADNAGRQMTINFGDVTNTDTNNAVTEKITITYQAVVINGGSNDRGDLRNNDADWNWTGGNTVSDFAPNVRIVEPTLDIAKTIVAATGDAGNTHAVTLVISHTGPSDADAFNIAISDALPAGMTVSGPITVTPTAGVTGLVNSSAGNTISVAAASIPDGDTIMITFNVTLDATVQPNELITNTADVDWTSLPGNVWQPRRLTTPWESNGPAIPVTWAEQSTTIPTAALTRF